MPVARGKPRNPRLHPGRALSRGLVLRLIFGEGKGASVRNLAGQGSAVFSGSPAWEGGPMGPALRLDGTDDYGRVAYRPSLDLSTASEFTVSGRFWYDGSMQSGALLSQFTTGHLGWMLWISGSTVIAYINDTFASSVAIPGSTGWR